MKIKEMLVEKCWIDPIINKNKQYLIKKIN